MIRLERWWLTGLSISERKMKVVLPQPNICSVLCMRQQGLPYHIEWSERYWIGYCLKGQHSWLLHAHAYASGFLPLIPFHHNPLPNKVRWEGLPVWTREFFQWHQTRRLKAVESSLHTRLAAHGWTELIHYSEGKNVGFDWTLKESAAIPEESDLLFCFTEHKEQAEFLTA